MNLFYNILKSFICTATVFSPTLSLSLTIATSLWAILHHADIKFLHVTFSSLSPLLTKFFLIWEDAFGYDLVFLHHLFRFIRWFCCSTDSRTYARSCSTGLFTIFFNPVIVTSLLQVGTERESVSRTFRYCSCFSWFYVFFSWFCTRSISCICAH